MTGKDDNASDNFRSYEDKKFTSKAQNIEEDHRDLVGKSSNTGNRVKIGRTF